MKLNEMFPSKYLRGADLPGPVTVTIASVKAEKMHKPGEGESMGWVMYCEKASKGVILTRPLAMGIAAILGVDDTEAWTGRQIVLYPQPMTVAGVARVAIPAAKATQPQPAGTNGNSQAAKETKRD